MKLAIFSTIIDNFGDAGFTIRLATSLTKKINPKDITIYTDYVKLFHKMVPDTELNIKSFDEYNEINDIIFFMFQHIPDQKIINKMNEISKKAYIIDYFTPEKWANDANDKISFVNGLKIPVKFIVPGLSEHSGGILDFPLTNKKEKTTNNVYLYTPEKVLDILKKGTIWGYKNKTHLKKMPFLPQKVFDSYLVGAKYNWIRGEDSFQMALNSGIPFFWEAYKQKDNIHHKKVNAFLEFISIFFTNNDMKQKYFKFTNYLNDIESLNHEEKKSIYDFFEKNYDELEGTFQLIKSHFKNKTNLQDLLIKKVTFL
jgi:hypothetical protein